MPRILGIDYGLRRVGLAVSDPLGIVATPLRTETVRGMAEAVRLVCVAAREVGAERVLVGLPLSMDASDSAMTRDARLFASELAAVVGCPVDLWDERLSTAEVERMLIQADVSRDRRKSVRDMLAAQVILQSYLEAHADRWDA